MSVTINAKGTSTSTFKVGKEGMTLSQDGMITPPANTDLVIDLDPDRNLVVTSGDVGPALITTTNNQDLHINPAAGGGQHLILNSTRWPTTVGGAGQTLVSNGSGVLSWTTASGTGTVTTASVVSANGFAGTVATASTTPAITLSTTVSGLLAGAAGALTAAVAGDITSLVDGTYVNVAGDTMTGTLVVTGPRITSRRTENDTASRFHIGLERGDGTGIVGLIGTEGDGSNGVAALTVHLGAGAPERMRLTSAGYLNVGSSSGAPSHLIYANTTDAALRVRNDGVGNLIELNRSGTALFVVDTAGQVGVGRTPAQLLDIQSASTSTTAISSRITNTQSGVAGALVVTGSGYNTLGVGGTSVWLTSEGATTPVVVGPQGVAPIQFVTNGAERARISATGNLAVGNTGSAWAFGSGTGTSFDLAATGTIVDAGGPNNVGFEIGRNWYFDGTDYRHKISGSASRYVQLAGSHIWYGAASGSSGAVVSWSERMRMDTAGNFAIGTSSTGGGRLTVFGGNGVLINGSGAAGYNGVQCINDSGITLALTAGGSTAAGWSQNAATLGTSTNHPLLFGTNNTERMRIDSSGNVGIGVTPSSRLDILSGNIRTQYKTFTIDVTGQDSTNPVARAMRFAPSTSSADNAHLTLGFYGNANVAEYGYLAFPTSDVTGFDSSKVLSILRSTGDIGIGTTSPTAPLDITGNTVRLRTSRTPASATAAGNAGDMCWDSNYIYICVATNTWKRTAISTW